MSEARKMGQKFEFYKILYEDEFKVEINIFLYQFFVKISNLCFKNAAMPSFNCNLIFKFCFLYPILIEKNENQSTKPGKIKKQGCVTDIKTFLEEKLKLI